MLETAGMETVKVLDQKAQALLDRLEAILKGLGEGTQVKIVVTLEQKETHDANES